MGKIIAVVGVDGSGKSTFIKSTELQSFHFYKIFKNKNTIKNKALSNNYKSYSYKIFISTILKYYIPNLIIYAYYKLLTKKTIIYDRYSFDFYGRYNSNYLPFKILNYLFVKFPKPDYTIFIDVDLDTALLRKKEFEKDFLVIKRNNLIKALKNKNIKNKILTINEHYNFNNLPNSYIRDIILKGFNKL